MSCLAYANASVGPWTMVDGELFLPERLFGGELADTGKEVGIPKGHKYETKIQLALKMIKLAKANGLPFELLPCDTLYGRDNQFRADLKTEGVKYIAQVPADTPV